VTEELDVDPFYIRATSSQIDGRCFVLKHGETFLVVDCHGDVRPVGLAEEGLYHNGTRHLSKLSLTFGRERPLLLSSAVSEDNSRVNVDLTNVDISVEGAIAIPRGTLHLARTIVLCDGVLYERIVLRNHGLDTVSTSLVVGFSADFSDIFEVRGTKRARRGQMITPGVDASGVVLGYRGLDGLTRRTTIAMEPVPSRMLPAGAVFDCRLAPQAEHVHVISYSCEQETRPVTVDFGTALDKASRTLSAHRAGGCDIVTSNHRMNAWLDRSLADLSMMITDTPYGEYPYAGVPWFSTPFGRDGIITALECLWINPRLARGVLCYLAATQATTTDPARDAQPGKILHEARAGEMAALGEIPFGRYYGSHDATPLFVMLAAAYYRRTADLDLIRSLWPAIEAALAWIERDGDIDGDGFIEYSRQSPNGLVQQGWKDSHDAIFHADGQLAEGPIALCEIQGYVYAAWKGAAKLAHLVGLPDEALRWSKRAEALRVKFEQQFWDADIQSYVLALDGAKRPCAVRTSNAGHVLFTGIASRERAEVVARTLFAPTAFSGWGIRTVAATESRYNPMSYHCGSIWPHDNAVIAAGCSNYGLRSAVLGILAGLFDASTYVDLHRLPELFCGFTRRPGEGPTLYPVACNPQAWASGSVFMILQASLGLEIIAAKNLVRFTRAKLPPFIGELYLHNLQVGPYSIDLHLERHEDDVGISVLRREAGVEIVSIK
jgi:glycogen debranching enzyme